MIILHKKKDMRRLTKTVDHQASSQIYRPYKTKRYEDTLDFNQYRERTPLRTAYSWMGSLCYSVIINKIKDFAGIDVDLLQTVGFLGEVLGKRDRCNADDTQLLDVVLRIKYVYWYSPWLFNELSLTI